jgi:acyl-CoA reductase-like NAD-dependent aldehyde dehydrogenase
MKLPVHFETAAAVPVGMDGPYTAETMSRAIASARVAQKNWAATPIALRLKMFRLICALIAEKTEPLAHAANPARRRPPAEILTAEILPLADACRFLERTAEKILRPKKFGARGRPLWLGRIHSEIHRAPLGVILVIGPSNYPLFLPCVQVLQALAAGNAVLLKPGLGGTPAADAFTQICSQAGLDENLIHLLPESPEAASGAIQAGVDKVILTGSATTGEAVLQMCAKNLTPATVELSGCDAVFLRADADVDLVVRALAFGLRLNGSATCIAPRRVFVPRSLATELEGRLAQHFQNARKPGFDVVVNPNLSLLAAQALADGAHLVAGKISAEGRLHTPLIFAGVKPGMRLAQADIFAPVLSLITVASDDDALEFCAQCPYALGATIFSRDEAAARLLAARIRAGVVLINDMIAPTADPRLPFGGRGRSGFGVTRGAEGLLEMTALKVVTIRRGESRPHFDEPQPADAGMFAAYIQAVHVSGWRNRLAAGKKLFHSLKQRATKTKNL